MLYTLNPMESNHRDGPTGHNNNRVDYLYSEYIHVIYIANEVMSSHVSQHSTYCTVKLTCSKKSAWQNC